MSLSPGQLRAGRALIGWSQDQLAEASKVAKATIANFEASKRQPYARTLDDLRAALESAGVIFVDENGEGPGVRLRKINTATEPLYVDASKTAVLEHGSKSVNCVTLRDAKIEYDKLSPERKSIAIIKSGGRVYAAQEIERFHYGEKTGS